MIDELGWTLPAALQCAVRCALVGTGVTGGKGLDGMIPLGRRESPFHSIAAEV